jgi:catechol 2,3-dioxygenase-like lactoylglutathione lyase family enzyme
MKAVFRSALPYASDAMQLPVHDVDAAIPYYERTLGFRVVTRRETPPRAVVLARDGIQIGLAENGGDPSQEGAFRLDQFAGAPYRVFFAIAPDGLCYMLGERTTA